MCLQVTEFPNRDIVCRSKRHFRPLLLRATQMLVATLYVNIFENWLFSQPSDVGIVVSIAAFQAVDPGSIPGHRNWSFFIFHFSCTFFFNSLSALFVLLLGMFENFPRKPCKRNGPGPKMRLGEDLTYRGRVFSRLPPRPSSSFSRIKENATRSFFARRGGKSEEEGKQKIC